MIYILNQLYTFCNRHFPSIRCFHLCSWSMWYLSLASLQFWEVIPGKERTLAVLLTVRWKMTFCKLLFLLSQHFSGPYNWMHSSSLYCIIQLNKFCNVLCCCRGGGKVGKKSVEQSYASVLAELTLQLGSCHGLVSTGQYEPLRWGPSLYYLVDLSSFNFLVIKFTAFLSFSLFIYLLILFKKKSLVNCSLVALFDLFY